MGRKKKKPMDKLSQDACDALAHGMSYGKWMAIKPPAVVVHEKPKCVIEKTCELCGKTFYRKNNIRVKYCSPECQHEALVQKTKQAKERNREKYREYQRKYQADYRKKDVNAVSVMQ